ncbi:MAG: hypothetical protein R3F59_37255 [Myxococcota bacterium]
MLVRGLLVVMSLLACKGEPKRSYCEALCDWAVGCAEADRDIDADAELAACLDATRASDPSCAKAEEGTIDPASAKLLSPCVTAIDDKAAAGECEPFTGTAQQVLTGTVPAACVTQAQDAVQTFEVAQSSTVESGAELCQRFADTICQRAEECILGDFGGEIPTAVTDQLGTPFDRCVEALAPVFTNDCISNDLYKAEQNVTDVNTARQAARDCLVDFAEVPCGDLLDQGSLPPQCAASQSSPDDLAAIGSAVVQIGLDYAEYAQ